MKCLLTPTGKRRSARHLPLSPYFVLIMFAWAVSVGFAQTTDSAGRKRSKYEVIEVKDGGTITGQVRFVGNPPKAAVIQITKDPQACGAKQVSEAFIVSPESNGLKNVVIRLVNVKAGKKMEYVANDRQTITPESTVTLAQKGCVFVPHAQIAFEGCKLNIVNDDTVLHNVHSYSSSKRRGNLRWAPSDTLFNYAQPPSNKPLVVPLKTGIMGIRCDVHEWMRGYIFVTDHPYVAITDEGGKYAISDVPPGKYRLEAWHEQLGRMKRKGSVEVAATQTVTVDFPIAPIEE